MNDHERCVANATDLQSLKDLFDSEIRRIDQVLAEREKQVNLAMLSSQKAIDKAEAEAERVRQSQNEWRGAMNDRERGFTPLSAHDLLQKQVEVLSQRQNEGRGRQTAWVAAAGIMATLIAIGVGQIIRQGITAADVSQQIQRESAWNRDKPIVERRITLLETQQQHQAIQISKLQSDLRAHVLIDTRK